MTTPTLFDVGLGGPGMGAAGATGVPAAEARTAITVLGLDLSLTATGAAGNAGGGWATTIKPPTKLRGHERMGHLVSEIFEKYLDGVDVVAVEGPSYGSQSGQAGHHERAGLWWIVTYRLWQRFTPTVVIPPSSLKKYATGKGNAGKDEMLSACVRRFDAFTGDNNAADATWLVAATADHFGAPMIAMPAANRAALDAIVWPDLGRGAA